ncbi:MAG: DNA-3-methyladenine glycosylase [Eubacteriales bacterium]|nr:DNA-3-methyladenine glycosylase [Eubacteriales bacterium]
MPKLPREFYTQDTLTVASELLGKLLCCNSGGVLTKGRIVEVEAYMGPEDQAAHSRNGIRSARTEIMYGSGGFAYVFMIYGMYRCMNIVTSAPGNPHAVLIRALEPVFGIENMIKRRNTQDIRKLTNGPGRLCQAMGIDMRHYGANLCGNELYLEDDGVPVEEIKTTPRINVEYAGEWAALPWRFIAAGSPYLSVREKR